jgi:hypothetical protein
MTVMGYGEGDKLNGDVDLIACGWWDEKELCIAYFHPDVLIHVQEPEVPPVAPAPQVLYLTVEPPE